MAQDPNCRAPHAWELSSPVPPPKEETYKTDPRIAKAKWQFKFLSESLRVSIGNVTTKYLVHTRSLRRWTRRRYLALWNLFLVHWSLWDRLGKILQLDLQ
jgi:hypothetical protein